MNASDKLASFSGLAMCGHRTVVSRKFMDFLLGSKEYKNDKIISNA